MEMIMITHFSIARRGFAAILLKLKHPHLQTTDYNQRLIRFVENRGWVVVCVTKKIRS